MLAAALLLALAGPSPAAQDAIGRAEAMAAQALVAAESRPEAALADARRALALTTQFDPVVFVRAGRKGEVLEDEFLAARAAYRRHRSRLYEAVGEGLVRSGRVAEGVRYLRRAVDLDPRPDARLRLARGLLPLGRGREALRVLLPPGGLPLPAEALSVAGQAADLAGVPSLQVEIDRVRLASRNLGPQVRVRPGPVALPERTKLSTGGPVDAGDAVMLVYAAEANCRTCSADLEQIHRQLPAGSRVLVLPASSDRDQELRQALRLYRYDWPVLVGAGSPQSLGIAPPAALVMARGGLLGVELPAPFGPELAAVLSALAIEDLKETRPRPQSRQRSPEPDPPPRPGLLPEGLAPAEDLPGPAELETAVAAFRAGHPGEALRLFGSLEARGDGFLLPPEARLNRAQCLVAQGKRDEARSLLLGIGDSRFQADVDRILESIGSRKAP